MSGVGRFEVSPVLKIALSALLAVATLVIIMRFSQTEMLFPTHAVPPAGPLLPGAERLEQEAADGNRLHGVHFKPSGIRDGEETLILAFGGNAWNGQDVAEYLHQVFPDAHVVAFHYRGYAPSTGSPSAEALMADAPLVHDLAVELVKPEKTVAVGFSIGSGVAATLASKRDIDGMILVTPFDSLKMVAADLFPWLPVGPLFQHELATAEALKDGDTPVAIIAGERDEIVLPARTAALRSQASNLVFDRTISGAGHNDIYQRDDFQQAMRQALQSVISATE